MVAAGGGGVAADDCESNRESEDAAAMSAKVSALLELATASVAMVVFGDVACVPLLPLLLQRAESAAPPLALAGKGCVSETTPGRAMSMRCCCASERAVASSALRSAASSSACLASAARMTLRTAWLPLGRA